MHSLDDDLGFVLGKDALEDLSAVYWSTMLVDYSIGTYSEVFFDETQYSRCSISRPLISIEGLSLSILIAAYFFSSNNSRWSTPSMSVPENRYRPLISF